MSELTVEVGSSRDHRTFSPIEMFRACADPGRRKPLRSLEIPLENLLSGIIFLSGGRDRRGGPILSLTQPEQQQVEFLMELSDKDILDMLAYFTSVPKEDVRSKGFSVLVDADVIHDFLLRILIKALNTLQAQLEDNLPFYRVYFISSTKDSSVIDWTVECNGEEIELPFHNVRTYKDLRQFIDKDQLTSEFKGTAPYNHQEWVRFRMQVEPFICDCVSVSKRLASAIEPFTHEEIPQSIPEAETSLEHHKLKRRKTLDSLHMDDLAMEGEKINQRMQSTSSSRSLEQNPDFVNTLGTIKKLLSQIETVKERLETLWTTRHDKLESNLMQRIFEREAQQIIEWFEEYAEEFFQTHTELGESLEIATTLVMEVQQFETSTQQILEKTDQVLQAGTELQQSSHTDQHNVQWLMGKIKQLMTDFDDRLGKRKKKLDDSVKLHRLTESALDWCIEAAALLTDHDIMSANPADIDAESIKQELDQFAIEFPPPTEEDLQLLTELTESTENHWVKENAFFAYTRVLEITERFQYYLKVLEEMVDEKKKKESEEQEVKQELVRKTKGVVKAMDSLIGVVTGENTDDVFLESVDGPLRLETGSGKGKLQKVESLHFESDLDEALMLLESAAKSASDRLDSQRAAPPACAIEAGVASPDEKDQHRIFKHDISGPTHTVGPHFERGSEDLTEDLDFDKRRFSCPEHIEEESLAAQTKHAKHRRQLMDELITTEEAYIRHLEHVVEHYMPAMDNLDELPRNLVGKKNFIFSNISQLLEFNRQVILPQLHQCRKCPIKLGQIFLAEEEDLLNYSMYFKNLPQQSKLMEEGGIDFFTSVQYALGDHFSLSAFLIKPFQRVTKYKLFLADMIKHSAKTDLKGKLKEYYDKLKEAYKMIDFILRHGNDLLAVESLKGFEGSLKEQGKILRQGDLTLVERTKHRRRVFLFEDSIILAKKRKTDKHHPDIPGSEVFEFKNAYKTSDFGLRETVPGHPTRFALWRKKEAIFFQADTEAEKTEWVQDIWDLFFSHMLQLKDKNLEAHGSRPLTSLITSGTATLTRGRMLGHSMRRSLRYSRGSRLSSDLRSRPPSGISNVSGSSKGSADLDPQLYAMMRPGGYSPGSTARSPRLSGTFVDLRANHRLSALSFTSVESDVTESHSNRSSIISTSSASTVTSMNFNNNNGEKQSQLVSEVHKVEDSSIIEEETSAEVSATKNGEEVLTPTSSQDPEDSVSSLIYNTPV